MGLYDKLRNGDSNLSINNGGSIASIPGASKYSTMHYNSSITNDPELTGGLLDGSSYPKPSTLDLDGSIPSMTTNPESKSQFKLPYDSNRPT